MNFNSPALRQLSGWAARVTLCLVFLFTSTGAGMLQQTRELGTLSLDLTRNPRANNICVGESVPLTFSVKNAAMWDFPPPVNEAMVEVSDGQGTSQARVTNAAGVATVYWPVKEARSYDLSVVARKTDYKSSAPVRLILQATDCKWSLRIDFQEEYAIIKEVGVVVGATTRWDGKLRALKPNPDSYDSEVELVGGSGEFKFYASDQIKAPVHISLKDPVSGEYKLRLNGTLSNGQLTLNMGAEPVQYPPVVPLEVKDYSNRDIQVKIYPPAPTSNGNGLFLESNKLNDVTFPAEGGVIHLDSGMSCYFYTEDRTLYSLTLTLYAVRGEQN